MGVVHLLGKHVGKLWLIVALVAVTLAVGVIIVGSCSGVTAKSANPLASVPFYVAKTSPASESEAAYRRAGNTRDAELMARIASQPQAVWLTSWQSLSWLHAALVHAGREHRLLTIVLYFIPERDCGSFSSGGATSPAEYRAWVKLIAAQLGHVQTAAIIEPDALPEMSCWSQSEQNTAYSLIHFAAAELTARPHTTVYLDAGNAAWQPAHTMVARLRRAGVGMVRGFSLNVSEFVSTPKTVAYGVRIATALGRKHFVIDTSRNGRGGIWQDGGIEWCNPPGRGLGLDPTTDTASPLVDAYLWVKTPGESDGPCNGGPPSGDWWPQYALGLAERAQQP